METSPYLLWNLLLNAFLGGVLLGAIYDTMRLSRVFLGVCHYTDISPGWKACSPFAKKISNKKIPPVFATVLFVIQDFCFCLSAGILIAILLFYGNNGNFRGFVPLGLLAGFLLYYVTIGKLLIKVSEYVIFTIKIAVLYVIFYLTRPLLLLAHLLGTWYSAIWERLFMRKLRRYDAAKRDMLLNLSDIGFVGVDWKENG